MKNAQTYIKKAFGSEPEWNDVKEEDIDGAILKAINWYVGGDKRNYKKWTLEWMKDKRSAWNKDQIDLVRRCPLADFKQFGHYCRMLSRGFPSRESINKVVNSEIGILLEKGGKKKEGSLENSQPSPRDRMKDQVSELAGELMSVCDNALQSITTQTDYYKNFKIDEWLKKREVGYKQAEMLGDLFSPSLAELDELLSGKDKQLQEGYSFLSKPQQKQLHKFMMALIAGCLKYNSEQKPIRKTRKRKVRPEKIVSKVKYQEVDKKNGIRSLPPIDIIDSKKVVVYNTKYNSLAVYYAKEHDTMTIKGTTIQNFCPVKSVCRSIKNPNKLVRKITNEKSLDSIWSSQNSMIKNPTGRLNESTVILKVFK